MASLARFVAAFLSALLVSWLGLIAAGSAAAWPLTPMTSTCAYDSQHLSLVTAIPVSERGPPSSTHRYTTYDAVVGCSIGAAATSSGPIPRAVAAYDTPIKLAQGARSTGTTKAPPQVAYGPPLVFDRASVAANNVIVDTNAVYNKPGVLGALNPGDVPVVTGTSRAEIANLAAAGRMKPPRFAGELDTVPDIMDIHLRINLRGQLAALKAGQPGLFGDGAVGATAIRSGQPGHHLR